MQCSVSSHLDVVNTVSPDLWTSRNCLSRSYPFLIFSLRLAIFSEISKIHVYVEGISRVHFLWFQVSSSIIYSQFDLPYLESVELHLIFLCRTVISMWFGFRHGAKFTFISFVKNCQSLQVFVAFRDKSQFSQSLGNHFANWHRRQMCCH